MKKIQLSDFAKAKTPEEEASENIAKINKLRKGKLKIIKDAGLKKGITLVNYDKSGKWVFIEQASIDYYGELNSPINMMAPIADFEKEIERIKQNNKKSKVLVKEVDYNNFIMNKLVDLKNKI